MKKKILVSHNLPREGFAELEKYFKVIFPTDSYFTLDSARDILPQVYGIIPTYAFKVTREVIDLAPNLRIVANFGTGYDNIDVEYATSKNIVMTNSPEPVIEPTAELAFALMIDLARGVSKADRAIRSGDVSFSVLHNLGNTLAGKTLGIVGFGNIGRTLARMVKPFKMDVVYYNRKQLPLESEYKYGVNYLPFERLLKVSDFVSIHTPLTDSSRHMFSCSEFEKMKQTAFLVNTSRGAVIDENALLDALSHKSIAGAALDVFEFEPHIPQALKELSNVVLTPHLGTSTIETRNAMSAFASNNIIRFSQGLNDITRVN